MNNDALVVEQYFFEGRAIRVVNEGGRLMFGAKEVCRALRVHSISAAMKRLQADEHILGSQVTVLQCGDLEEFLTEAGLFRLVLASKKPVAERFKIWVTCSVIPAAFRKFAAKERGDLSDPDFVILLASKMKTATEQLRKLREKINEREEVSLDDMGQNLQEVGIDMDYDNLVSWMVLHGYLYNEACFDAVPLLFEVDRGHFTCEAIAKPSAFGAYVVHRTMVTRAGQLFFYRLLVGEFGGVSC